MLFTKCDVTTLAYKERVPARCLKLKAKQDVSNIFLETVSSKQNLDPECAAHNVKRKRTCALLLCQGQTGVF